MATLLHTLRRMALFAVLLSSFALPTLLAGCGQTGPLYLPDDSGSSETVGAESIGSENSPAQTD